MLDMPTPRTLHLLDSIALITPEMADGVVVTGSHGGSSAASFVLALTHKPYAVFFNDAGIGKDDAGVVALALMQEVDVIAAVYAHTSARIGDANDGWRNGIITRCNALAQAAGIASNQTVHQMVDQMVG
jgi:hypothetical protein